MRTLNSGFSGEDVKQIQRIVGADVDGVYGSETAAKVIDFQARMGLTRDGIVGPKTWVAILEYSGEEPVSPQLKNTASSLTLNEMMSTAGVVMLLAGISTAIYKRRRQ